MKTQIILTLFLALFVNTIAFSQVKVEISNDIKVINGKTYHIHEVLKGQTLYSISNAYNVSIDVIKTTNKLSDNKLSEGFLLKIPAKKEVIDNDINNSGIQLSMENHIVQKGETLYGIAKMYKTNVENIKKLNPGISDNIEEGQVIIVLVKKTTTPEDSSIFHIVEAGQTLYSIAKSYLLTVKELKELNPGLTNEIQIGQKILVGIQTSEDQVEHDTIPANCEDPALLDEYNIALLIPLKMEYAGARIFRSNDKDKNDFYQFSPFHYIEFYEGLKFAIDTMTRAGMKINLHVYDLDDSEEKLSKVLESPDLKKMNLIIGPFSKTWLDTLSSFSYENEIPLASCFLTGEISLREINPYYFNPVTSIYFQMVSLTEYFNESKPDANIIVAYQGTPMESTAAIVFDSVMKESEFESYHLVNLTENGLSGVTGNFNGSKENIIVSLANGEIFISNYIRNLNKYKKNFNISIMPLPGWLNYENLDLEFLEYLHANFFGSYFTDFERKDVREFSKHFQKEYKCDPNNLGFMGYDYGVYFLSALHQYGPKFTDCISKLKVNTLSTGFNWYEIPGEGYHNKCIKLYKMHDFQLWDINKDLRLD